MITKIRYCWQTSPYIEVYSTINNEREPILTSKGVETSLILHRFLESLINGGTLSGVSIEHIPVSESETLPLILRVTQALLHSKDFNFETTPISELFSSDLTQQYWITILEEATHKKYAGPRNVQGLIDDHMTICSILSALL